MTLRINDIVPGGHPRLRHTLATLALAAAATPAFAERCDALSGQTQCLHFRYSSGAEATWTAVFGSDGTFSFPAGMRGGPGTFSCTKRRFVALQYFTDGYHLDYAQVDGVDGLLHSGLGRAADGSYMYSFTTTLGACDQDGMISSRAR
jgi:hypothetical protein